MSDPVAPTNASQLKRQAERVKALLMAKLCYRRAIWQQDPAAMEQWIALVAKDENFAVTSEIRPLGDHRQVVIIRVCGHITSDNGDAVVRASWPFLQQNKLAYIVDLRQAFAVSHGELAAVLCKTAADIRAKGGLVVAVGDSLDMHTMFKEIDSEQGEPMLLFATVEDAMAYLAREMMPLPVTTVTTTPSGIAAPPAPKVFDEILLGEAEPERLRGEARPEKKAPAPPARPASAPAGAAAPSRRAAPAPAPQPAKPEHWHEVERGITLPESKPVAPPPPAAPPVLGGMAPAPAKTAKPKPAEKAKRKKEAKPQEIPEPRRDEQLQRQQKVDEGTGMVAMPKPAAQTPPPEPADKRSFAPEGGEVAAAPAPEAEELVFEEEEGSVDLDELVFEEDASVELDEMEESADDFKKRQAEEAPAEEDRRTVAKDLKKSLPGAAAAVSETTKEAREEAARETSKLDRERVTTTRAGVAVGGKRQLAEQPAFADIDLLPAQHARKAARPWWLPFKLLLLPLWIVLYVGKGALYVGKGVLFLLYKCVLLPKLVWDSCARLRRRILEQSRATGIPWFELLLGDDAGRPGAVERAAAQSVLFLRAMQATIGLKFILLANAVDIVLDALASYVGSIFRTWKMMKTIQRRLKRELQQSQVQSVLQDLVVARIRLARLFSFAGFELERCARQLPSSMQKEWQEIVAPSFPLKMTIDARGHLDEMKRDLDFLTTSEVMGFAQKTGKDFLASFIPNPASFLTAWKDWFIIAFFMRYTRTDLERMYADMVRGYLRTATLLKDKLAAENKNAGGEDQAMLWQSMEYEQEMFARVGAGTAMASDLRDATNKNRRALQRLIQAMCNPGHLLDPRRWSMADLAAEVATLRAHGQTNTRCELELERRLTSRLEKLLLQFRGKPSLEEQELRLREARDWRRQYRQ